MPQTLRLPDLDTLDPAALKALLLTHHERYITTLSSRASEIERLVLLVEKLQRMLFGAKSEKVLRQIEQLELQLEELQAASAIESIKDTARPFRSAGDSPVKTIWAGNCSRPVSKCCSIGFCKEAFRG
jgi:hypothetical protein